MKAYWGTDLLSDISPIKPGDMVEGLRYISRRTNPYGSGYLNCTIEVMYEFESETRGIGRVFVKEPDIRPEDADLCDYQQLAIRLAARLLSTQERATT